MYEEQNHKIIIKFEIITFSTNIRNIKLDESEKTISESIMLMLEVVNHFVT